jgi:uncharacterized repeat protein (TIGR01451 family)
LLPFGTTWKYLDDGSNQDTAWRTVGFDDSAWASGAAQLGFGDGDEATSLNAGDITYYFRHTFTIADTDAINALALELLRDDGAVVYLNGTEVFRSNMPSSSITYQTRATYAMGGASEDNIYTTSILPSLLQSGSNLLAVEVHQRSSSSSDISFDLALNAINNNLCAGIRVDKQANTIAASVGQSVSYSYQVTNIGTTTLNELSLNDDQLGAVTLHKKSLQVGEGMSGTLTYVVQMSDLPGPLVNSVMGMGSPAVGNPVTDTDSVSLMLIAPSATAEIGNYLWLDENSDGYQDAGEAGLPNLVVELYQNDQLLSSATTDAQGYYLFTGLLPGSYVIQVDATSLPEGLTQSSTTVLSGADFGNQGPFYTIMLADGERNLTADFGYNWNPTADVTNNLGSAALGDRVWIDVNGDGIQGTNEIGASDIVLNLYHDPDGDGSYDSLFASTTSNATGHYLFDELPPDAYLLELDASNFEFAGSLTGYTQTGDPDEVAQPATAPDNRTTTPVILAPGDVLLNADFGYQPDSVRVGTISGMIWFDADGSGTASMDADEYGLAGITVSLLEEEAIIATTVTQADGAYHFDGLPLKPTYQTYRVWVNDSHNRLRHLLPTYDADGVVTYSMSSAALSLGTPNRLKQDFSYTSSKKRAFAQPADEIRLSSAITGTIGGQIWLDNNADGFNDGPAGPDGESSTTEDNEPGIAEVTLELYQDSNANGQVDAGEALSGTTTTDASGLYTFTHLLSDDNQRSYLIHVTDAEGILNGYWHSSGTTGADQHSQASPYAITLTQEAHQDVTADFGYYVEGAALGNFVWHDQNGDGLQDGSEVGMADVPVMLEITYPDSTAITLTSTSKVDGSYRFGNLLLDENFDGSGSAGVDEPTFVISVETPTTYAPTMVEVNGNSQELADSDEHSGVQANPLQGFSDIPAPTTPTDEPAIASYDFGFIIPLDAIGDYVWFDSNANGVQEGDELGIPDVTLILTAGDDTLLTSTTDISGTYLFDELPAGDYTITVQTDTLPSEVLQTFDPDGTLDNSTSLSLSTGNNRDDIDFGYQPQLGSIGDYIWLDSDGNGQQDGNEHGIADVLLLLTDEKSNTFTTTTDADGSYLFDQLPVSQYTIMVSPNSLPRSVAQTYDPDGRLLNTSSVTWQVVQQRQDIDFGYDDSCAASIDNTIWHDSNGNGKQDPGEDGIAGVVVELVSAGEDNVLGTEDDMYYPSYTTSADGQYAFINLPAGRYRVDVDETTLAEGLALTTGNEPMLITLETCEEFDDHDFGYGASLCQRSVMYGVHDAESQNSQFFTLDLATGQTSPLGGEYTGYDIEAIEIDPTTDQLVAIAGNNGNQDGKIFSIDKETGALSELGKASVSDELEDEIVSATFDAQGVLWAFEQNIGLVTIDLDQDTTSLAWDIRPTTISDRNWEGLAWDPDGNYLYGSDGRKMYRWNPTTQSAEQVCDNNFLPNATEALDFRFDGKLIGGWHNATDNALSIFEIDIYSCAIVPLQYNIPYNDVESLASEECVTGGTVGGQVINNQPLNRRITQGEIEYTEPIPDLPLELEVDINGDGSFGFSTTITTDDNGFYNFINLPKGAYRLSVPNSANTVQFELNDGELDQEIEIGYTGVRYELFLPLSQR